MSDEDWNEDYEDRKAELFLGYKEKVVDREITIGEEYAFAAGFDLGYELGYQQGVVISW